MHESKRKIDNIRGSIWLRVCPVHGAHSIIRMEQQSEAEWRGYFIVHIVTEYLSSLLILHKSNAHQPQSFQLDLSHFLISLATQNKTNIAFATQFEMMEICFQFSYKLCVNTTAPNQKQNKNFTMSSLHSTVSVCVDLSAYSNGVWYRFVVRLWVCVCVCEGKIRTFVRVDAIFDSHSFCFPPLYTCICISKIRASSVKACQMPHGVE